MGKNREYMVGYDAVLNASINGLITKRMATTGFTKIFDLIKIIDEISEISGIHYPPVIILPEARMVEDVNGVTAVVFATLNYRRFGDRVTPVVETYLPLLLYGNKQVLKAIFAHELLHYIYIAIKYLREESLVNLNVYTSSLSTVVFVDEVYQIRPEFVFSNSPSYVRMLNNMDKILRQHKLAYLIKKNWIDREKPTKKFSSKEFRKRMSSGDLARMYFPDDVLDKVRELMDHYVE